MSALGRPPAPPALRRVNVPVRLMTSAALLTMSPVTLPMAPLPICRVPALIVVPPL